MELNDALRTLRERDEEVPRPLPLPTAAQLDAAEKALGLTFHADYRRFQLEAGNVTVGTVEPFVLTAPGSEVDLLEEAPLAWEAGAPRDRLPFCGDNGNYFCLAADGDVSYWSHDGATDESWPNLASWIQTVWLED